MLDSSEAVDLVDGAEGSSSRVIGGRREGSVLAESSRVSETDGLVDVGIDDSELPKKKRGTAVNSDQLSLEREFGFKNERRKLTSS